MLRVDWRVAPLVAPETLYQELMLRKLHKCRRDQILPRKFRQARRNFTPTRKSLCCDCW